MNAKQQTTKLLFKPLLTAILFFGVFSIGGLLFAYYNWSNQTDTYLEVTYQSESQKVEHARLTLGKMAQYSFQSVILNDQIISLMHEANSQNPQLQDRARKALYERLFKDYQLLKSHHVRQLHFHLPDNISFLRFHRPNKYGDSLVGVRHSIDKVNRTLESIVGFEEGRIFNGFRHIYPLFHQTQFVGTVEISYGTDGISQILTHDGKSNEMFLLSREIIKEKLFESEKSNYEISGLSEDWLLDINAWQATQKLDVIPQATIHEINKNLQQLFSNKISQQKYCKGCAKAVYHKGKVYTVSFIPISNINGDKAAYFITYKHDAFIPSINAAAKRFSVIIVLLFAVLSAVLYVVLKIRFQALINIHHSALHDELTGIYNRKQLTEALPSLLEEARAEGSRIGVIFFDIDHFKLFNDTHGHVCGDEVLMSLSSLVEKTLRHEDLFIRWGGEEFVIIIQEATPEHMQLIAEKLRSTIENHRFTSHNLKVTSSFGITLSHRGDSSNSIIERADELLYTAKKQGRNQVVADFTA